MQIFCDESGGADPANDRFVVSAISIPSAAAVRLLKSFRKSVKSKTAEVKGHILTRDQRAVFFDLLMREAEINCVVVSCSREDHLGGWAMGAMAESELYFHLVLEACMALRGSYVGPLTVTLDGGRYKRSDLRLIADKLARIFGGEASQDVRVTFEDSASFAGLQIADVVANSSFQALDRSPAGTFATELLGSLICSDRLILQPVELTDCRPNWIGLS